jgi:hypothetical protein
MLPRAMGTLSAIHLEMEIAPGWETAKDSA